MRCGVLRDPIEQTPVGLGGLVEVIICRGGGCACLCALRRCALVGFVAAVWEEGVRWRVVKIGEGVWRGHTGFCLDGIFC